jgi:hypothetical protein
MVFPFGGKIRSGTYNHHPDKNRTNPGVGTPTGRVDNAGTVLLTPTNNPLVFEWVTDGFHVLTDDDGDQIFMSGGGSVELIPTGNMDGNHTEFTAEWSADFHIQGGNGKYEGIPPENRPIAVETNAEEPVLEVVSKPNVATVVSTVFATKVRLRQPWLL